MRCWRCSRARTRASSCSSWGSPGTAGPGMPGGLPPTRTGYRHPRPRSPGRSRPRLRVGRPPPAGAAGAGARACLLRSLGRRRAERHGRARGPALVDWGACPAGAVAGCVGSGAQYVPRPPRPAAAFRRLWRVVTGLARKTCHSARPPARQPARAPRRPLYTERGPGQTGQAAGTSDLARWRSGGMRTTSQARPTRSMALMISPERSISHGRSP